MSDDRFSRRTVLLGAAGAAAVAGTARAQDSQDPPNRAVGRPAPQVGGPQPLPEDQKVGFAVVGLGKLALGQVLPAFGSSAYAKLAAVVSGNADKAGRVAAQAGLPQDAIYNYDNYDTMADDPRIQVVYVILPNGLHADYTIRALRAGKHVLCEKPMANTPQECEAMIAAARQADRQLMIAYRCHYEPHNLEAMRAIRNGELGDLRMVSTANGRPSSLDDPADQWRLDWELSGGGALLDIGIYGINGARYLLNEEPVEVRAWQYTPPRDPRFDETPDVIAWQFRMPSGVLVNGSTSFSYASTSRLEVIGEKARLEMDPATNYNGISMAIRGQGTQREPQLPEIDQFAREMDWMAQVVRGEKPMVSTAEEGLQDVRLMTAILESLRQNGAPVPTNFGYTRALDPAEVVNKPRQG